MGKGGHLFLLKKNGDGKATSSLYLVLKRGKGDGDGMDPSFFY